MRSANKRWEDKLYLEMQFVKMKGAWIALCLGALLATQLQAQVIISEVSASKGFVDEVGASADWIELFNAGASFVDLSGYALSDDANTWDEWIFPEFEIQPGERVLVLASGKDKPYLAWNWEFGVSETDVWQYITPSSDPGSNWTSLDYDDSNWDTGNGGFGYGDNDDGTVLDQITSVYLRKTFWVDDLETIGYMAFSMDFDDGYIAYLNGHEISRSGTMEGVLAQFDALTNTDAEAVLYSGGTPDYKLWEAEDLESILAAGQNVLAIQSHNVSNTSSDLSARPFLGFTNQNNETLGWSPPPNWWSDIPSWLHTSFKISPGETIVLSAPDGTPIDVAPVNPELETGLSMGRVDSNPGGDWCIFDTPTPGTSNAGSTCYTGIEPPPLFLENSGWYNESFDVHVQSTSSMQTLRFTSNGDIPSTSDPEISGPIAMNTTGILTARAWGQSGNTLPSRAVDATYCINENQFGLPVISIITDSLNLWDWNEGIYVLGPNASNQYPHFGANFWEPWSKTSRLQLFDESGTLQAEEVFDLEIHGGWSRAEPQRSFRLDFKGGYSGDLEYPLFAEKPGIVAFNNINLRNGGQHSWATKIQDAAISHMALGTHNLVSAWQPFQVYLNGVFWGVYGAREKLDEHFVADNAGTDVDNVDLMNSWGVLHGSGNSFYDAVNLLMEAPTGTAGYFDLFGERFDVENYIDYFAFEIYGQNTDWMGIAWGTNNVKLCRETNWGGKWKYILYDNDASFGYFGASYWDNFIENARNPGFPSSHSELFDRVLDNEAFRFRFINRYADLINTTFQPLSFNAVIISMMDEIQLAMPEHIARWNSPGSTAQWLNAIDNLTTYNANRIGSARTNINSSFALEGQIQCTLDVLPPLAGTVQISTITPGPLPWDGIYFKGCPVQISATAASGWLFDHWDANDHTALSQMDALALSNLIDLQGDDLFRARFVPCPIEAAVSIAVEGLGATVETDQVPYIDSIGWHMDGNWAGNGLYFEPEISGFYSATVYFSGCAVTSDVLWVGTVSVLETPPANSTISIHPNPARAAVEITANAGPLDIFNALGQLQLQLPKSERDLSGQYLWRLSITDWPNGIYWLRAGEATGTLIIEK